MEKKYYVVRTYMNFEREVLVPCDEVEDGEEAMELVSNAVEMCKIDLLNEEADCGEEIMGFANEECEKYHQVIRKEEN